MNQIQKHRYFGTPIDQWVSRIPNELIQDAVGLWQITPCFIEDFGLSGKDLQNYTRQAIQQLILHGAVPVQAPSTGLVRHDLFSEKGPDVEKVMNYLNSLGRPPTVDDVWFELP